MKLRYPIALTVILGLYGYHLGYQHGLERGAPNVIGRIEFDCSPTAAGSASPLPAAAASESLRRLHERHLSQASRG